MDLLVLARVLVVRLISSLDGYPNKREESIGCSYIYSIAVPRSYIASLRLSSSAPSTSAAWSGR